MPGRPVKICCIQHEGEADLALSAGADYLGLVSAMPSGPGPIPEDRIRAILDHLPDRKVGVLLTSLDTAAEIAEQARRLEALTLQLCTRLPEYELIQLRDLLPGAVLMPVVHVAGPDAVAIAESFATYADALLLDSGTPDAKVPVLGGTGKTHDWDISRAIVEAVGIPVLLAGGLTPGNVGDAIRKVGPEGVDVCSGVRKNGLLDPFLVQEFVAAAKEA